MRFLKNITNPKIRDVLFVALSPALMVLFASGLDLERSAPGWWAVFLVIAVVWSIAFYRLLGNILSDVRIKSQS
jgi:hypothetical protein